MAHLAYASYSDASGLIDFHQHRYHELVLVTAGRCEFDTAGVRIAAGAGCVAVHPADIPHAQCNQGRVRTSYVGFEQATGFDPAFRVIALPAGDPARRWLEDLVAGFRQADAGDRDELDLLLGALLARLARLEQRELALSHPGLEAVLRHLEADLAAEHDLRHLATIAGCSVGHLGQLARRELGTSVMRWLQDRRLEVASRLLRDPYRTVAEIAAEVGFSDPTWFIRLFRRRYGTTPGRWRSGE